MFATVCQAYGVHKAFTATTFQWLDASSYRSWIGANRYYENPDASYYLELNATDLRNTDTWLAFYKAVCSQAAEDAITLGSAYSNVKATIAASKEQFASLTDEVRSSRYSFTFPYYNNGTIDPTTGYLQPDHFGYITAPGRWAELGDEFTQFPYMGPLGTFKHLSLDGFPNPTMISFSRIKDLRSLRQYLQYALPDFLAPKCTYGGQVIE